LIKNLNGRLFLLLSLLLVSHLVIGEVALLTDGIKLPEALEVDAPSPESSETADYLIGPLDLIEVKVLYAEDISRTVRVDSKGNISLPLIGEIKAAKLTSFELEKVIAEKLSKDLIQNPQVSVFIKEFTSLRMTVQGAVTRAGLYDFQGRATLLQAISMAGGVTEKANQQRIKVIRRLPSAGSQTLEFDLFAVRLNKIDDPVLQNGDIVVVEENLPIGVQGNVRKSGNFYPSGATMTLTQAISNTEGLTNIADPSDIHVVRNTGKGTQITMVYDLRKIQSGELPDPDLLPGDLVVVESSGIKSVLYGITNTLRGFVIPFTPN
jgi:polysaccharide biosynthesis/export protein